jgi:hypothetical protein
MKDKRNKYIKILAQKIVDLEKQIQMGENVQECQEKIEKIMLSLNIEDMLAVDDYIMSKKLLTK